MLDAVVFGHAALPAGDPGDHRACGAGGEGALAAAGTGGRRAGAARAAGGAGARDVGRGLSGEGEAGAPGEGGAGAHGGSRGAGRGGARGGQCSRPALRRPRGGHGAQRHPRHRHAHRRARHPDSPADHRRGRRAAARARQRAVHPRRDAGIVRRDPGHRAGRADRRCARRRISRALHAALQLPALLGGRGRADGQPWPARDRPRQARLAGGASAAAEQGGVSLHDARGERDHREQRLRPRWRPSAAPRSR